MQDQPALATRCVVWVWRIQYALAWYGWSGRSCQLHPGRVQTSLRDASGGGDHDFANALGVPTAYGGCTE